MLIDGAKQYGIATAVDGCISMRKHSAREKVTECILCVIIHKIILKIYNIFVMENISIVEQCSTGARMVTRMIIPVIYL